MKTKWKQILEDKNSFADDMKIDMGNGNVMSLGDLRADDIESKGAVTASLTAKERQLAEEKQQLERASVQVTTLFQQYLDITGLTPEEAIAGKKPVSVKTVAANTELDANDPIVGKLVGVINSLKDEVGTIKGTLSSHQEKILKPMLSTYLDDYYQDRWNDKLEPGLPKAAKGKIEFEQVMKHAEKEGYKDSRGRLDLNKAVRDLTYDYRVDEAATSRAQEQVKKMRDEETVAAMGKPGTIGPGRNSTPKQFKNEKGRTINLDQALEMARQDADIWTGGATAGNA